MNKHKVQNPKSKKRKGVLLYHWLLKSIHAETARKGKSFIFIAGYSIYGRATPPSIYPFPYPCCKGIKIDIRITKHQNQVRTGWDKSEREKKKEMEPGGTYRGFDDTHNS